MMKRCWILLVVLGILTLVACQTHTIRGNGIMESDARDVNPYPYHEIHVSGFYKVLIDSDQPHHASVYADENVIPYIETHSEDDTLSIYTKPGYSIISRQIPYVHIGIRELNRLVVSGVNQVTVNQINAETLNVRISGANKVVLSGVVEHLFLNISGTDQVDTTALKAKQAIVNMSGASEVKLNVSDQLAVTISGSGKVTYYGSPKKVVKKISGAAQIVSGK